MSETLTKDAVLAGMEAIVGASHVLTGAEEKAPYLSEWRGYYHGASPAVVRPGSAHEIAEVLKLANRTGTPIVPQGGNTGLVGGQTPDESGREIVLSLERLDTIRSVDAAGAMIVAEAGVVLENLHIAAEEAGMLFPLTLGSQGSCRIGGNISTNAGGTQVLAYGNTRNLVLGLEVVLPTGEIWDGLRGLIKDNSGYDLKQLFIGAEGTLGIVTAAVLKLFPRPRGQVVAFVGIEKASDSLALLKLARERAGVGLTAFELMPRIAIEMLTTYLDGARDPLESAHPWYVLMEIASGKDEPDAQALAEDVLSAGFEAGIVTDAAIAQSVAQARDFWRMRHALSEIQKHEGASIKHDVSVPVPRMADLIAAGSAAVEELVPGVRPVPFGHIGDGNLHFNFSQPVGMDAKAFMARAQEVHRTVHGIVAGMGGSIAAEHGVGRYKRTLLKDVKSEVELDMMRKLKRAFDPNNILNPGRIV